MSEIKKIRVAVVGSGAESIEGYSTIINFSERFKSVGTYSSSKKLIEEIPLKLPSVIILILGLDEGDEIEVIRKIKSKFEHIDIILTSAPTERQFVFEALRAGVTGILSKDASVFDLFDALEEIEKGGAPLSSAISRLIVNDYHINANSPMTRRESEILQLIAEGKTYSQIAEELNIAKDTSKTHIRNIYEKLNVASKSEAILKAKTEKWIKS